MRQIRDDANKSNENANITNDLAFRLNTSSPYSLLFAENTSDCFVRYMTPEQIEEERKMTLEREGTKFSKWREVFPNLKNNGTGHVDSNSVEKQ